MTQSQPLWTGTAGSLLLLLGAVPLTQAVEVMEPYAPPGVQQKQNLSPTPNTQQTTPPNSSPTDLLNSVGLTFDLPTLNPPKPSLEGKAIIMTGLPADWWEKGSDSPIAIAIGMAEGTRTLDGGKTAAYFWHEDPGNGANNFGTFSYQHLPPQKTQDVDRQADRAAKREMAKAQRLPEESDRLQLQRLKKFAQELENQARQKGIELSTLELVNGLDLANQSEAAALTAWGYIDRLAQMRQLLPNERDEQIKEARAWSYWNPDRNTWDAPGLGNNYESIRYDQTRRFTAVAKALATYSDRSETKNPDTMSLASDLEGSVAQNREALGNLTPEERAMAILFL